MRPDPALLRTPCERRRLVGAHGNDAEVVRQRPEQLSPDPLYMRERSLPAARPLRRPVARESDHRRNHHHRLVVRHGTPSVRPCSTDVPDYTQWCLGEWR